MSVLSGTNQPIYTTDVGWEYSVNLSADMATDATIASATVSVDWATGPYGPWSTPAPSLQPDAATWLDQTVTVFVGNGAMQAGYVRIRSEVTTTESPPHTFQDITAPPIPVIAAPPN